MLSVSGRATHSPMAKGARQARQAFHLGKRETVACSATQVERIALASTAAALGVLSLLAQPAPVLAVPQTSACATEICDGFDYSNRDLRREFYTKGSLRGANFRNSNLNNVSLFGANLEDADFTGADLSLANLGQANLHGANLTQATLEGAIMSSARFNEKTIIDGADFTDVIIRKDINDLLCKLAKGVNDKSGISTKDSLMCF